MPTIFKATANSQEKYKRISHGSNKIPNVTMLTERLADMLICENCKKNWNEHTGYSVNSCPIGMCLTETNLKEYHLELL